MAEYGLTEVLRPDLLANYAAMFEESGVGPERVATLFQSPPEAMTKALSALDAEYGSISQFLMKSCGVTAEVIRNLRAAATTEQSR